MSTAAESTTAKASATEAATARTSGRTDAGDDGIDGEIGKFDVAAVDGIAIARGKLTATENDGLASFA